MICNKCNSGEMTEREGKNGKFLACNAYPECRNTESMPKGLPQGVHPSPEPTVSEVETPQVEKVLDKKTSSRDGSYVTAGEIIKEAVKIMVSCADNKIDTSKEDFTRIVCDVMDEYKRVREEFK